MPADFYYEDHESDLAAQEAAHIGGYPGEYFDSTGVQRAVIEAGGGEKDGFEDSERLLIEHTSHGNQKPASAIIRHQGLAEELDDRDAYGEAEHEYSSELDDEEDELSGVQELYA
jgi:hypothetical protein